MSPTDISKLQTLMANRVIGHRIIYKDTLHSTMNEVSRLATSGKPEGTVVVSELQTSARGRFNRKWISPRGVNLLFSVLLRPRQAHLSQINMAATLAVSYTVKRFTNLQPSIKWPNDVRLRSRKVAGILIESTFTGQSLQHSVLGIGINVNFVTSESLEISDTATSMLLESGQSFDRIKILGSVIETLDDLYATICKNESLVEKWASELDTLGQTVRLESHGNVIEGNAESVDRQGNLVLRKRNGSIFTAVAGEVTLQTKNNTYSENKRC
ncbi:MAG: biotin--[acetyl-CoA-carboxylase] ligase [Chloroflexota bacterium]|nr:biotin--[acetyl-CoA-carboxylase] ligase [Chloroflexota bacterium]